jgi:hypothetical protein
VKKLSNHWKKMHYETLRFLEMYFPLAFFDINVHFTTHLIKEIKLLGSVCRKRETRARYEHLI